MKKKSIKFEEVYGKYEKYAIGWMKKGAFQVWESNCTCDRIKYILEEIIEKDNPYELDLKWSIIPKESSYKFEERTYALLATSILKRINEIQLNGNNN